MAKRADLGEKHSCEECGARFYDLKRPKPACPKCGTVVQPVSSRKKARKKAAERKKAKAAEEEAAKKAAATQVVSDEDDDDEEDDVEEINLDGENVSFEGVKGDDDDEDAVPEAPAIDGEEGELPDGEVEVEADGDDDLIVEDDD